MSSRGIIDLWAIQFPIEDIPSILNLILNSWKTFEFRGVCLELECN